jgi:O-acetyl-ADP-ribose deacetylase (regulator of RNase III)/transcriptional regulator with XRE-family HTH domain
MQVDAIVNTADRTLKQGGGVCGAIFEAAGAAELQVACEKLTPIQTGDAVVTSGFGLNAKWIIHTAGPVYLDGEQDEEEFLRACYRNSLKRALEIGAESVAFPLISSGIYGYPKAEALQVATEEIRAFLDEHDLDVSIVVFDREAFEISEELLEEVECYIDDNYVDEHYVARRTSLNEMEHVILASINFDYVESKKVELEDFDWTLDEAFGVTLLRLIDAKGMTDVDVYKRANLDRKLFSKIRTGKGYMPSKRTAVALAIALELDVEETEDLLKRAGFALSQSQLFDVIVSFFIENGIYDIDQINGALFAKDQPLLGC